MKTKYLFLLMLAAAMPLPGVGQDSYMAGRASVSIEPSREFFSLPLQGYGDPPEGRFTLEWIEKGVVAEPKYIAGMGSSLYLLAPDGDLFLADAENLSAGWEKVGSTNPVVLLAGSDPNSFKIITGCDEKLYAVSLNNRLSVYDTSVSPMKWEVVCDKTPDAVAMAPAGGRIYLMDASGVLWSTSASSDIRWEKAGNSSFKTISMASRGDMLYALSDNQRLWESDTSAGSVIWREIAYINGVTYAKPLKGIAVAGGRLYGTGLDDVFYESVNKSDGTLSARCLALSADGDTVAIIAADIGAIDLSLTREIKEEIYDRYGIAPESVMINVSHSHFSPVSKFWYAFGESGYPDKRYLTLLKSKMVECVGAALSDMKEAKLWFARTESCIGFNRSLSGNDAVYDPTVDVVRVEPVDGSCGTVVFMTGCHPVFPNSGEERYTISANYIGVARNVVEELTSTENSIFLQGCGGDINPRLEDYRALGTVLGFDAAAAAEGKMSPVRGRINSWLDSLPVAVSPMSREGVERFREENINRTGDIEAEKNVRWADRMTAYYDAGDLPRTINVYIQTLNIGNWKILGLSREPVTEYGLKIRGVYGNGKTSVLGYCNDVSSYLPNATHMDAGTYEGHDSYLWYGEPAVFPEDIMEKIISKIKKDKR